LSSTSELRDFRPCWTNDERVLLLADQHGKTVREYALACGHKWIREDAMEHQFELKYESLLKMIVNENTPFSEILEYCRDLEFVHYMDQIKRNEQASLLHASIGAGRLDVLSWLDRAFYSNLLPQSLVGTKWQARDEPQLNVLCQSNVEVKVGDFLEIECCFRVNFNSVDLQNGSNLSTTALDGKWELKGWMPNSASPFNMIVYDLCGRIADAPGVTPCEFSITSSGLVKIHFHSDTWISTSAISGAVSQLEFKRAKKTSYVETERRVTMTRIADLEGEDVPTRWRVAGVVDSTDTKLKVSYCKARWHPSNSTLGKSFDEWIPKHSPRINRSGVLRSEYEIRMFIFSADKPKPPLISGRELAMRCARSDVVQWIDTADAAAGIQKHLRELDDEFLRAFLSDTPEIRLEQMIANGQRHLLESNLPAGVGESLEGSLYVLDRCWGTQPIPNGYHKCRREVGDGCFLPRAGLLAIAVCLNKLDRVRWIIDTKQIRSASAQLRIAAAHAAHVDNLTMVKEMLGRGVQPIGDFSQFDLGFFFVDNELNLLDIAVQSLSGEVACFLLDSALIPIDQLSGSLISHCVTQHPVHRSNTEHAAEKKLHFRAAILERLLSRGLRPTNFTVQSRSTMQEFLETVERSVINPRADYVPIDAQTLRMLCNCGGDIVSAADQYRSLRFGGLGINSFAPNWLSEFVANIRSDHELIQTLLAEKMFCAERMEQLLDGREISIRDCSGRCLLECACIDGHFGLVEWLVREKGADACSVNLDGLKIRDLCAQLGHKHIVELLDLLAGAENVSKEE